MLINPKLIVALDVEDKAQLESIVSQLDPTLCRLKVGITLYTQFGPTLVQTLQARGFEVFLDLKFHDIPQQVSGACQQADRLGVWMMNVHALGGLAMLKAARKAVEKPLLIGVTILTSFSAQDLPQIGLSQDIDAAVLQLASLCYEAELDGVVCSAQEVQKIKARFGPKFLCVTPGIRLPGEATQDQQRVLTPSEALRAGSDYLVMGRSITHAPSITQTLKQIERDSQAL